MIVFENIMKLLIPFFAAVLVVSTARAEFRTWARLDGKSAELELVSVSGPKGGMTGEFKMRNGKSISIPASTLAAADAKLLEDWQPAKAEISATTPAGQGSVFDKMLDGNLVALSGRSFKSVKELPRPEKYFLFYYTASWCGPCHKFTPSLVEFYTKHKDPRFELVLVTSDSDERAMEDYAKEFKMPWPQLKLSKVEKFKEQFDHPGTGIPNLVLTDLQGNLIKTSYVGKDYFGPTLVMDHLASLLK